MAMAGALSSAPMTALSSALEEDPRAAQLRSLQAHEAAIAGAAAAAPGDTSWDTF